VAKPGTSAVSLCKTDYFEKQIDRGRRLAKGARALMRT
jgi:hypothetical protein